MLQPKAIAKLGGCGTMLGPCRGRTNRPPWPIQMRKARSSRGKAMPQLPSTPVQPWRLQVLLW